MKAIAWSKGILDDKLIRWIGAALIILLITGVASYRSTLQLSDATAGSAQANLIIQALSILRAQVGEIEAGARGYAATGTNLLLEPLHQTALKIDQRFAELTALLGSSSRRERVQALHQLIDQKVALAERIIELRQFQGVEAATRWIGTPGDKSATEEIFRIVGEMEGAELSSITERDAAAKKSIRTLIWILAAGGTLSIVIVTLAVASVHRDARGRASYEQVLRENNERLGDFLDNANDLVQIVGPDQRFLYVNRKWRETLGYSEEDLARLSLQDIIHPEHRAGCAAEFEKMMRGEKTANAEIVMQSRDGRPVTVSVNSSARMEDGKVAGIRCICREVKDTRRFELSLRRTNEDLMRTIVLLEQHSHELDRLAKMNDLLHSCVITQEAHKVIAQSLPQVMPFFTGALMMLNTSRTHLQVVARWGDYVPPETVIPAEDCWALRRGRPHLVDAMEPALQCGHPCRPDSSGYLCIPLVAQGETLGVLHLEEDSLLSREPGAFRDRLPESMLRLAMTAADQIALALAGLKSREVLQQQSIRDPLTRLFNRRYLEEELEREVRRAARKRRPVAVAVIGLDHFKRFNESFGPSAGDTMLRNVGTLLADRVRREDVTCRFGGDQFAVVLPESSLESVQARSEELRRQAKHLKIQLRGEFMGFVTMSIGVAAFPEHGATADELLRAADRALYRAKTEGRDRVALAAQ